MKQSGERRIWACAQYEEVWALLRPDPIADPYFTFTVMTAFLESGL